MTPLRGYFKTSAGIFAAGHFRGLGESFCNHHLEGGWDARSANDTFRAVNFYSIATEAPKMIEKLEMYSEEKEK